MRPGAATVVPGMQLMLLDKIKIDRSFVKEFVERTDCVAIVRAISGLGRSRQGRAYLHVEQHSSCCSAG